MPTCGRSAMLREWRASGDEIQTYSQYRHERTRPAMPRADPRCGGAQHHVLVRVDDLAGLLRTSLIGCHHFLRSRAALNLEQQMDGAVALDHFRVLEHQVPIVEAAEVRLALALAWPTATSPA
jgi:hypothetical protein